MRSVLGCAAQQNVTVWVLLLLLELGDEPVPVLLHSGAQRVRSEPVPHSRDTQSRKWRAHTTGSRIRGAKKRERRRCTGGEPGRQRGPCAACTQGSGAAAARLWTRNTLTIAQSFFHSVLLWVSIPYPRPRKTRDIPARPASRPAVCHSCFCTCRKLTSLERSAH